MSLSIAPTHTRVDSTGALPPLQSGDRLTAAEFERRFDATPDLRKAELINGVVYMPPPVIEGSHGAPHADFALLVGWYKACTPGLIAGIDSTLRLDARNRPQPDLYLRIDEASGGQSSSDAAGYPSAGPELVIEIAASTAGYDLHDKLDLYAAYQVREYVVWRTFDRAIDWMELTAEGYKPLPADGDGVFRSRVMPGFWVDSRSLLAGQSRDAFSVLERGIASTEHQAFVDRLAAAREART